MKNVIQCVLFSALFHALVLRAAEPQKLEFNRDIRPILSDHCFACHGPDKNKRKSGMRLDDPEQPFKAAKSGKTAIFPGDPSKSELIKRIFSKEDEDLMPPPEFHKPLSAAQKDLLKRWVDQGAQYQPHWSYIPPVKVPLTGKGSAIDELVGKRLEQLGLKPSPEADWRTLIRRLYFDLVGLPPKPEEADAFIKDASPDAYSKLAEKLLADPHYGERMAQGWLDVVRYADTIGYHSDNPRNVYPYRDYVIAAFNSNKRFDQFTIEQIAGDLLPNATQETKVASAFNRLLLSTEEGGAQAKDYEQRMLTDRVRAIGTAWLGQTTGCAQCHDHKFDPITQRDFYSLGAFFADIKENVLGAREPGMPVLNDEQQKKLEAIDARLAELKTEFGRPRPELAEAQSEWERKALESLNSATKWSALAPEKPSAEKRTKLSVDKDNIIKATVPPIRAGEIPGDGTDTYRLTFKAALKGVTGFRLEALKGKDANIGLAGNGNFVLSEISAELPGKKALKFAKATATFEQASFPAAAAIDGIADKKDNGWGVLGGTGADQSLYLELAGNQEVESETPITFVLKFGWGDNHAISHLRISSTTSPRPINAPGTAAPLKDVADILKLDPAKRTAAQRDKLAEQFKQIVPELAELRSKLATAEKEKKDFEASVPKCLVSMTGAARTVRILPRGNWMDESGEVVKPAVPHYLPQPKVEGRALTRLDLAQWLVARENPLTARAFVNRLWKQFFGTGLSKNPEDLGAQGEPPANAALLDWLAAEFMDSGWDVKHMVREIVISGTYRQVSTAPKEMLARDPYNRELARQSRYRLDAEQVRDNALAIAGLLSPKIGGASVKPYQPDGYWENLNFPVRTYVADTGESQYRRGLYTWWQRSFLHPSMVAFDAPSREECCADRGRSNIPQQALVLLNDPTYVEAARVFAEHIIKEGGAETDGRIAWAWRKALQRAPRADEAKTIRELVEKHRAEYTQDAKGAEAYVKTGMAPVPGDLDKAELAAWTDAARVILNLHETVTRN